MNDRRRWRRWDSRAQPFLDVFHHGQRARVRNRALELIGPSLELAFEVAVGTAETLESGCAPIDFLHRDEHVDHLLADLAALRGRLREMLVVGANDVAAHVLHQVERRADVRRIVARSVHARDRDGGRLQSLQHAIFAHHVVRGRQQRSARRASQRPRMAVEVNEVNLVGMAERDIFGAKCGGVAELALLEEALEAVQVDRRGRSGFFLGRGTHRGYCFRKRGSRSSAAILRRSGAARTNEVQ